LAAASTLSLAASFGIDAAHAEISAKTAKADKAIVVTRLNWEPNAPAEADWVAFRPGTPSVPRADAKALATDHRGTSPLNDAFDLFAKSEPAKIADPKAYQLRTASLDPNAVWVPGAGRTTADDAGSAATAAPVGPDGSAQVPAPGQIPLAPRIGLGIPVPRSKPPVPKVVVASLTPASGTLPDVETHERTLDAAPVLGEPKRIPLGASAYLEIFRREAAIHKIPLWLALGVAWVESKFDPKLRGTHTVVGMMQVMPSTAREMGYRGTTNQLFDPETNIIWGIKELAKDYEIAKGDICLTIAKYKGGFRTNHINKGAWNYCGQVKHITGMTEVAERFNSRPAKDTTAAAQQ
jgi:hypothetical protein